MDIERRIFLAGLSGAAVAAPLLAACAGDTQKDTEKKAGGAAVLALTTVALSWTFVHLIFAFHYAHAFYAPAGKGKDFGGLLFPGGEAPDYWDFLHFSLIIGVAQQTADIQITARTLRRTATVHSVTAFLFNTVIVALTVNLAVGLLGGG